MDESKIVLSNDDYEVVENAELLPDVAECFDNVPDVARPLIGNAERLFKRIERTLYSAPSFIYGKQNATKSDTLLRLRR